MRVLFMVLFMAFAVTVNTFAQTDLAQQYFEEGNEFAKAEKYEKAIEFYNKSLKVVKKDKGLKTKIQYNIGVSYYQLKQFKKAEKSFDKAIKINKDYVQAIYSLGLTQIELKQLNSAKSSFTKVIGLDEKHSEAWFDLGMVFLEQKKYLNAKIAFEKSIEYKTTRLAEAQNNLGVISALQGNIQAAVSQFRLAFFQSKGKLLLAKNNLEFWLKYEHTNLENMLAAK